MAEIRHNNDNRDIELIGGYQ